MAFDEPALFVAGLFAVTLAGALLPIRLEGREDHVVLTMAGAVDAALLGARGLLLVWCAVAAAGPLIVAMTPLPWRRALGVPGAIRSIAWLVVSAVSVSVGFLCANFVYSGLLSHQYPITLQSTPDVLVAALVAVVGWVATMSIRLLSQRAISKPLITQGLDPFESPLIPYLLPLMGGFPLITASVAMYRPADPWPALIILWWCFPVYGATVFELHRRRIGQELRRDVLAKQRLAAIGEVSARIVHQSRHQVGLMGWSIHRLRGLTGATEADDLVAARRELDALADAKDRLSTMLASELLHEGEATDGDEVPGSGSSPADGADVLDVVTEVSDQLRGEAERQGLALTIEVDPAYRPEPAGKRLRDCVFNLLDNAIDAASSRVVVRVRDLDGSGSVIAVIDDGPGVPVGDVDKVFEPFFTTKSDGTGMGLAIADALAGDLGGQLSYERDGTATTFVVVLPGH